jgi:hypothetical protein
MEIQNLNIVNYITNSSDNTGTVEIEVSLSPKLYLTVPWGLGTILLSTLHCSASL